MATPYDLDDDLSTLLLGTMRSPGKVTLSGHNRDKAWNVKKSKGAVGASSSLEGDPIGQFEALFELAGDDVDGVTDFDLWEDFQRLIESMTNGPTPVALPIFHPDLARNHYTEVSSGGVGGMVHDGKGGASVKVKFIEYKPEKAKPPAKAKPKPDASGTATTNSKPTKPDPNAARKAELSRLLDEADKP